MMTKIIILCCLSLPAMVSKVPLVSAPAMGNDSSLYSTPLLSVSDAKRTLLIFTGSDWCQNCRRLEKNVLSDPDFIALSAEYLDIEKVDFPQQKKLDDETVKRNEFLAQQYNFKGIYPTILLLDAAGKPLTEIRYKNQTAATFIDQIRPYLSE